MERKQVSPGDLGKVVRFEIEHEDGTVVLYTGQEAADHVAALDAACLIAHGAPLAWAVYGDGLPDDQPLRNEHGEAVDLLVFHDEESARHMAADLDICGEDASTDIELEVAPLVPIRPPIKWPTALPQVGKMPGRASVAEALVQIGHLADFIMAEVPGEPSASEGAIETAIRLLRAAYVGRVARVRLDVPDPLLPDKPIPRLIGDLRRFVQWYGPFGVLDALVTVFRSAPAPDVVDRMAGEHLAARSLFDQLAVVWARTGNGEG